MDNELKQALSRDVSFLNELYSTDEVIVANLPPETRHIYCLIAAQVLAKLNDKVLSYVHEHPKYIDMKTSDILNIFKEELSYYISLNSENIKEIADEIEELATKTQKELEEKQNAGI